MLSGTLCVMALPAETVDLASVNSRLRELRRFL